MPKSEIKISNGNKGIWTYYYYDEFESYEEAEEMARKIKNYYDDKGLSIKRFIINEGKIYPIYYLYMSKRVGDDI